MKLEYIRLGDNISRYESSFEELFTRMGFTTQSQVIVYKCNIESSFQGFLANYLRVTTSLEGIIFWVEFRTEYMPAEECGLFIDAIDDYYDLKEPHEHYFKSKQTEFPGEFVRNITGNNSKPKPKWGWFRMVDSSFCYYIANKIVIDV